MENKRPTSIDQIKTLDVSQTACFLCCSDKKILEIAGEGHLKGVKIGKSWLFLETDVIDYLHSEIEKQTAQRISRWLPQPSNTATDSYKRQPSKGRRNSTPIVDLSKYQTVDS